MAGKDRSNLWPPKHSKSGIETAGRWHLDKNTQLRGQRPGQQGGDSERQVQTIMGVLITKEEIQDRK